MSGGDRAAISWFLAAICVFVIALFIGLLKAIFEQPWLLGVIALAFVVYLLARREERRKRGLGRRQR